MPSIALPARNGITQAALYGFENGNWETELGARRPGVGNGLAPNGRRRLPKSRPKHRVETPNAAEAGQHGYLGAGKVRLLD